MDQNKPILVASLVDVSDMRQSSDLGRIVSEQVSSRLTQLGYQTKEMKFRGSFLVSEGAGEFVLSRALRDISRKQDAQAVSPQRTGSVIACRCTAFTGRCEFAVRMFGKVRSPNRTEWRT